LGGWQSGSAFTRTGSRLEGSAANVSGAASGAALAALAAGIKALHAKTGEPALAKDFLEGAPGKAGLLNARRRLTVVMR
jgi:transposase